MKYIITQSRLLYVLSINDRKHTGLLKVGEVFVNNDVADDPCVQNLEKAVRNVLGPRSYMQGITYQIEYVECTTYNQQTKRYTADDVYRQLRKMGAPSKSFETINREPADIWFVTNLATIKDAIAEIKAGNGAGYGEIKFRPEQEKAISETVSYFKKDFKDVKKGKAFLWNAKMRFGKTLSGLELAKRMEFKSTLIITHRPVVDKGWHDDFYKIFGVDSDYEYATRMMEDGDSKGDFYQLTRLVDAGKKRLIFFVSMQFLRLSTLVGGSNDDPLKKAIMKYDWDFVMVDEAHEGIEAARGFRVMEQLKKERTRILSLSGTPFNLLDKYEEGEIYTWDYVMEQRAKQEWDDKHFGDPNPYADLPRMQILTFTLPKMVRDQAMENNEVFRFHEFFRVWTEEDKNSIQRLIDNESNPVKLGELKNRLSNIRVNHFIHENAVKSFLDKLVEDSDTSQYPFSTDEFRENFRHTFWLLPGVKEATALEMLLKEHDVFGVENGMFKIINVAGDGNIEDKYGKALKEVENHIRGNAAENITKKDYTITLSCGKLTTGVSIPEWTAVLCMKGSENTPASGYMQTIFRVQTHAVLEGRQKSDCYVFDFAPDRALTAVAETAKMAVYAQTEKGKKQMKLTQKKEEEHLEAFIKLCPVLSMDEGEMGRQFTANQIFEKLSNVYIERAVRSGYADNSLYNPEQLMNLTPEQEKALGDVHDLLGSMPASWKPEKININSQGIGNTDAEQVKYVYYNTASSNLPEQPRKSDDLDDEGRPVTYTEGWEEVMTVPTELFPYLYVSSTRLIDDSWTEFSKPVLWKQWIDKDKDTDEAKKQRDQENKEKRARMSVLRGVSIRIPLLVYGAEINDDAGEEITIDNFASDEIVDDASWEEFMPKGFTKETFNILKDCFDRAIFTGAAKRIRAMVKEADNLSTEDRINKIATIFSYFHNPDKETVLTPWRVVNMHLSDCLGGYCFWNEEFDAAYTEENAYGEFVPAARFVDRGDVTQNIFGDYNARILEINSKTGLYPLYMAYSIFKHIKEPEYYKSKLTGERGVSRTAEQYYRQAGNDLEIWKDVLQDNIFVVCRTLMAVSITKRTLAGFRKDIRMNVRCYGRIVDEAELDMIEVIRSKPEVFEQDVVKGKSFWNVYNSIPFKTNEDINDMKFTAIVGNPPYQLMGGSGGSNDAPIYQHFFDAAKNITGNYVSLIIPSRWFAAGRDALLGDFRSYMLKQEHVKSLKAFVDSRALFPTVEIKGGVCYFLVNVNYKGKCRYSLINKGVTEEHELNLGDFDIMIRSPKLAPIVKHVLDKTKEMGLDNISSVISNDTPFGIPSNPRSSKKNPYAVSSMPTDEFDVPLYIKNKVREIEYVRRKDIHKNEQDINRVKVFVPGAAGTGQDSMILGKPWLASSPSVCTQTFIYADFDNIEQAKNFISYYTTKFFRALVSAIKITQSAANDVYQFVPAVDFNESWNDKKLFELFEINQEDQNYINNLIADWNDGVEDISE